MQYLLVFIFLIVLVFLNARQYFFKICNHYFYTQKTMIQNIQNILWSESKQNYDLIKNTILGIKSYFDAENIFYAVSNSKDKMSFVSFEFEVSEDIKKICNTAINNSSIIEYFKLNEKFYTSYTLNVSGFNVGVLLICHREEYRLSEVDLIVLQSFSEFINLKQKTEILEEALCKSEADLETIMNNATDGVVFCDKDGIINRTNQNSVIFSDIEDCNNILGMHVDKVFKIVNDETEYKIKDLIDNSLMKKKSIIIQKEILLEKEEKRISVNLKSIPIFSLTNSEGSIVFFNDIDAERKIKIEKEKRHQEKEKHYLELQSEVLQRKEIEKSLIQSTALAYAGTLAAGVAHEYNNINSIAMGNLDVLLKMDTLPPFVLECISTIRRTTARGAEITRSLLDYAKDASNGNIKRESVSLVSLAEETMKLVIREFSKEGIEFSSNFNEIDNDNSTFFVSVNASQIKQVILNLVLNARHAVSELDKKIISFEVEFDDSYIFLKISDTGHGIPKEDIEKLFDPFFTTKGKFAREKSQEKFDGTGLGLAVTKMIMKQHGGSIDVSSSIGQGTQFLLSFLRTTEDEFEKDEELQTEDIEIRHGQNKKILILDDELELCKLLFNTLVGSGYVVKYTDDGHEALKWNLQDPFDLILTDIQMPKMSGTEFLNNLSMNENQKIIVMTGRVNKKDLKDIKINEFIYKPFNLFALIGKIQEILGV